VNYVRKWGRDFAAWRDTAGTYVQTPIVDDAGKDPTGQTFNIFRLTSDPGARQFELGNSDLAFTDIHALSANVTKRMTRWYANAGVTYLRANGTVGGSIRSTSIQQRSGLEFSQFGRNPNDFVNADGRLNGDVGWQYKLQTVVKLPSAFRHRRVSTREGAHRLRTRAIPRRSPGVVHDHRAAAARRSRSSSFRHHRRCPGAEGVSLGRGARLGVFLDILNLNNENALQSVVSASVTSSSSQFPTTFVAPRRLMLSGKFTSELPVTVMFWPVALFMAISMAIGLYTYTKVRGSGARFAVCERSLPFIVVGTALMAQAVDGNSTLGAVSLTYTTSVWAGLMISAGLALSLVVVGRFLAAPLNRMNLLTLPEFFYRRYGRHTELLVSIVTIVSFLILIAGNLSAVAWVLSVVSGITYLPALVTAALVIVVYTIAGGLYSAIWTDFFQEYLALVGFAAAAVWVLMTRGFGNLIAAVPSSTVDLSSLVSLQAGALVNWAGLIALVFGNAMALDFMERVFAARDGRTARAPATTAPR
jgi:hypothetical protein